MHRGTMADLSPDSEESFWPVVPVESHAQNFAQLYRGYKKLINTISEKLRKQEVLSLVYQYDLPSWYSEIGPTFEPCYALRVLIQMESMQIFSPTSLAGLARALEDVGRSDLSNSIRTFEKEQEAMLADTIVEPAGVTFQRTRARRSFDTPRRTGQWMFSSVRQQHHHSLDTLLCDQEKYDEAGQTNSQMHMFNSTDASSMEGVHNRDGPLSFDPSASLPVETSTIPSRQDGALMSMNLIKLSAQALANQTQILRQQLASNGGMYMDLDQALLQAFFSAQQVCSSLNIATDELKKKIQIDQEWSPGTKPPIWQLDPYCSLTYKSTSLPQNYSSSYGTQRHNLQVPVVNWSLNMPQDSNETYHFRSSSGLHTPVEDFNKRNMRPLSRSYSQPLYQDRTLLERTRRKCSNAFSKQNTPSPQTKFHQTNLSEPISWSSSNDDMWESHVSREPPPLIENGYTGPHEYSDTIYPSNDLTLLSKEDADVVQPNLYRKPKVSKSADNLLDMGERVSKEKSSWGMKWFKRKKDSSPKAN